MIPTVAATADSGEDGWQRRQSRPVKKGRDSHRYSATYQNSGDSASQTESTIASTKNCFMMSPGATAHRHAYADLVRSFRHGNKHDVHDSNSAHHQGNQRDN